MANENQLSSQQTDKLDPSVDAGVAVGQLLEATPQQAEASALAQVFQNLHETEKITLVELDDGGVEEIPHALVLPAGKRLVSLKPYVDQYLRRPERKRGTARFTELASFVAHVNRSKTVHTVLFGDATNTSARLIAVYDYNAPGDGATDWQEHRAEYAFPLSDEWIAWKKSEGVDRMMPMQKFAEFLESRVMDVAMPSAIKADSLAAKMKEQLGIEFASPSRLIQISKHVSISSEAAFVQAVDLQGGAKNFSFKEKDSDAAGQPFKIEGGFLINIPVFRGDRSWIIPVQLRYRKANGLQFFYDVYRMDLHFFESVKAACAKVTADTGLEVLMGTPELPGA